MTFTEREILDIQSALSAAIEKLETDTARAVNWMKATRAISTVEELKGQQKAINQRRQQTDRLRELHGKIGGIIRKTLVK